MDKAGKKHPLANDLGSSWCDPLTRDSKKAPL